PERGGPAPPHARPRVPRLLRPPVAGERALPVKSRLGLALLGILVALGLAEGVVRVAAALDSRVRFLATGRATRPEVRYLTLEAFIASQAAHITPHKRWFNSWTNAFGFHAA